MKRKTAIIFTILVTISAVYLAIGNQSPRETQGPPATPTTVPLSPQIINRVNIKGISVNNFLETSRTIEETGEVFVAEKTEYKIVYNKNNDSFLISILSSPFESVRQNAEANFLEILGIDEISACELDVIIGTPHFVNPDSSGAIYPLSFCQR